jgi:hypothetical protein
MPDPRASSQAWAEWMLLTGQLEQAEDSRCSSTIKQPQSRRMQLAFSMRYPFSAVFLDLAICLFNFSTLSSTSLIALASSLGSQL